MRLRTVVLVVVVAVATSCAGPDTTVLSDEAPVLEVGAAGAIPTFEYDPTWPAALPNNWMTGPIGAMAIDAQDHVWIIQRPSGTTNLSERYGLEGLGECCFPAPPVLEFDQTGALIQSWGPAADVEWPLSEHGLYADHQDTVWVGNQSPPSQILRFSRDGRFLMRLGQGEATGNNGTANLAGPTGIVVDPLTNEIFVADGYRNRRVIVAPRGTRPVAG